jgi:hypothetical protein
MSLGHGAGIVRSGLVLHLDAANRKSYPGNGTVINDLTSNGYNSTLTNGVGYNSANNGSLVFDGIDDYVTRANSIRVGGKNKILTTEIAFFLPSDGGGDLLSNEREHPTNNGHGLYQCTTTSLRFAQHSNPAAPYLYYLTASSTGFSKIRINGWNIVSWALNIGETTMSCNYMINGYTETVNAAIIWNGTEVTTDDNLDLGRWRNYTYGTGSAKFNLGSLRVYNRLLTVKEQLQNFEALRGRFGI